MGTEKIVTKYDPGAEISGEGWLCLHRNENLFVSRDWTIDTAKKLVQEAAISTYPGPTCEKLRETIAELYDVNPENVFVGNGSDEVLSDLLGLLRHSYESMSVLDVCFKIYLLLAERFGFRLDILPGNTFETGQISVDGWRGLAVVDSPNAITSTCLSLENLNELASDAHSFLIWDNAYGEFAGDTLPKTIQKNVAVVRTFSKFYGLAGLRIGYCIADGAIVDELLARKDAFNVNGFAQVMALEALRRREEFNSLWYQLLECRQELVTRLRSLGFQVHKPSGNFVLATHPTYSAEFIQRELQKRRVAVRRFQGELTSNFMRITVPPMAGVERLIDALTEVLKPSLCSS